MTSWTEENEKKGYSNTNRDCVLGVREGISWFESRVRESSGASLEFYCILTYISTLPGGPAVKNLPTKQETWVRSQGEVG